MSQKSFLKLRFVISPEHVLYINRVGMKSCSPVHHRLVLGFPLGGERIQEKRFLLLFFAFQKILELFYFLKYKFIYLNWRLITLQYCIGFAIHWHESATDLLSAVPLCTSSYQSSQQPYDVGNLTSIFQMKKLKFKNKACF